jgi:hypothetical protein
LKLRVAFLLALTLFAFGASTIVGLNVSIPMLHSVSYSTTWNVGLPEQPFGDPVDGPGLPH